MQSKKWFSNRIQNGSVIWMLCKRSNHTIHEHTFACVIANNNNNNQKKIKRNTISHQLLKSKLIYCICMLFCTNDFGVIVLRGRFLPRFKNKCSVFRVRWNCLWATWNNPFEESTYSPFIKMEFYLALPLQLIHEASYLFLLPSFWSSLTLSAWEKFLVFFRFLCFILVIFISVCRHRHTPYILKQPGIRLCTLGKCTLDLFSMRANQPNWESNWKRTINHAIKEECIAIRL